MKNKWDKKYLYYGMTLIGVAVVAITFWELISNIGAIKGFISKFIDSMTGVVIGLVLAYLLNPVVKWFEEKLFHPFADRLAKKSRKMKNRDIFVFRLSRALSIIATMVLFIGLIAGFLWLVVPQIYTSILTISESIPTYVENVENWLEKLWRMDNDKLQWVNNILDETTDALTKFMNGDLIPKMGNIIKNVSSGVIGGVRFLLNFLVGLMVSIYVLAGKEKFIAQSKKMLYAFTSKHVANRILRAVRQMDRIFGGFINGKIVDSIIIGLICYIGMLLLRLPFGVLIAAIVGITNIIPFFGPFIGAIPSAILVFMVSPMQCLIFVIWILILQQLDGNIIGPMIIGDSVGVSGLWIIVAITIGSGMYGVMGMVLGVPVFACIYNLLRYLCNHMLRKKELPTKTSEYGDIERIDSATGEIFRLGDAKTQAMVKEIVRHDLEKDMPEFREEAEEDAEVKE